MKAVYSPSITPISGNDRGASKNAIQATAKCGEPPSVDGMQIVQSLHATGSLERQCSAFYRVQPPRTMKDTLLSFLSGVFAAGIGLGVAIAARLPRRRPGVYIAPYRRF